MAQQTKRRTKNTLVQLCALVFLLTIAGSVMQLGLWFLRQYTDVQRTAVSAVSTGRTKKSSSHLYKNQCEMVYEFKHNSYTEFVHMNKTLPKGERATIYVMNGNPKLAYAEPQTKRFDPYLAYAVLCFAVVLFLVYLFTKNPEIFCFLGIFDWFTSSMGLY